MWERVCECGRGVLVWARVRKCQRWCVSVGKGVRVCGRGCVGEGVNGRGCDSGRWCER